MKLEPLPPQVLAILKQQGASPRLLAHLTIVYTVALTLTARFEILFPGLIYDREAVLIGAATHDIGKTVYPAELTSPGSQHEEIGPDLLLAYGLPEHHARFARTHGQWHQKLSIQLEDLLVAFADAIWKGKRDSALENALAEQIATQYQQSIWDVYMKIDDLASDLAKGAYERIIFQGRHAL